MKQRKLGVNAYNSCEPAKRGETNASNLTLVLVASDQMKKSIVYSLVKNSYFVALN